MQLYLAYTFLPSVIETNEFGGGEEEYDLKDSFIGTNDEEDDKLEGDNNERYEEEEDVNINDSEENEYEKK